MYRRRSRFTPALSLVMETLESRFVLSASAGSAEVAAQALHPAVTQTTLAVSSGALGQPITFNVTVRAAAAAGAPQGTVNIVDDGQVIATATVAPTTSTNSRFAYSEGTAVYTPQPGGAAPYFGRYTVSATFTPSGSFSKSVSRRAKFSVSEPQFAKLSDGVEYATIAQGSGPQIHSGQTAGVLYTGYLAKTGEIFDDSSKEGGTPFSFTLGGGQVIQGFDDAVEGMQVGESRVVVIPPTDGYGSSANANVPANSTLVFIVTLESIS
jgi:hypothetical protein